MRRQDCHSTLQHSSLAINQPADALLTHERWDQRTLMIVRNFRAKGRIVKPQMTRYRYDGAAQQVKHNLPAKVTVPVRKIVRNETCLKHLRIV